MPDDEARGKDENHTQPVSSFSRRRWLQIAGVGTAAGVITASASAGSDDLPNTILIDGSAESGTATYEFLVSEDVEPHPEIGGEPVTGGHVEGTVDDGQDAYLFSGTLSYLDVEGNAEVTLQYGDIENEETVDRDRLEIVAGSESEVTYEFTSDDTITKVLDNGDRSADEGEDTVLETSSGTWLAEGSTANGYGDTYDLDGELEEFHPVTGDFTLFYNGEAVTVTELTGQEPVEEKTEEETAEPEHTITIQSTDETPAMYYEFTVDGAVVAGENTRDHDEVSEESDGWRVNGQVGPNGADTYEVAQKLSTWNVVDSDGQYVDESRFGLYWNGEEVSLDEVLLDENPDEDHVISIRSTDQTPGMYYEFTVDGEIEALDDTMDHDEVTEEDGVWLADGQVGPNGTDSYRVQRRLSSWEVLDEDGRWVDQSRFDLYWDDQPVRIEDILLGELPTRRLEIVAPADETVEYVFESSGEITMMRGDDIRAKETEDDTWAVTGVISDNGSAEVDFAGQALTFTPKEDVAVYLEGEQITPYELLGEESPNDGSSSDESELGGGAGYDRIVTESEADYVVSTRSDLSSALSAASSGDVVFIDSDSEISMNNTSLDIGGGVTLASDRGHNGSSGALLYTQRGSEPSQLFRMGSNARITGIRMRGPWTGGPNGDTYSNAVSALRTGIEIDNCEIGQFSYAGVNLNNGEAHVHHNYIYENNRGGLGYGVTMSSGQPVIEYNYFNFNRHSIASTGSHTGYICRYNHFGPDSTGGVIDIHSPAGVESEVHNNVVEAVISTSGHRDPLQSVQIRGTPDQSYDVYNNWFWNHLEPRSSPAGWTNEAIIQATESSWANIGIWGNAYGEDANTSFSNVIPGYDGDWS